MRKFLLCLSAVCLMGLWASSAQAQCYRGYGYGHSVYRSVPVTSYYGGFYGGRGVSIGIHSGYYNPYSIGYHHSHFHRGSNIYRHRGVARYCPRTGRFLGYY
ncbi:MAG TPA: hypothetical protein PKD64_04660 [Pirellulaceae bacterium]|nr:hypothetical protein [Pirellulaceae bacterium]HMO91465.1 hypothetical protein [Pirellulaceae bacterium]HMP69458.1 hypothetical protein [Pirellulaceae bacterium]